MLSEVPLIWLVTVVLVDVKLVPLALPPLINTPCEPVKSETALPWMSNEVAVTLDPALKRTP